MQRLKRALSLILCLAMLFGVIPFGTLAAETGTKQVLDAAVIFSDLHTSSSNYKKSTVTGIMKAVAGLPISTVTSAGDAFSSNEDQYTGYTDTITDYIRGELGDDMPVYYVWSDHDRGAVKNATDTVKLSNDSGLVYGTGAGENYYIYSLSMADLSTNNRYGANFHTDAEVTQTIAAFKEMAKGLDHTKPLLIASHMPLFERRNDNGHAEEWFDAICEVAEYMDVAYFFGHNHDYDQSGDYYAAKGSKMIVETNNSPSTSNNGVEKTLNFTHLCAGYLSPSTKDQNTREGTAVAVSIYDDSIGFTTYNASGVYSGNFAVNETVSRAFAGGNTNPDPNPDTPTDPEPEEELKWTKVSDGQNEEIFRLTSSLTAGQKYVIVNSKTEGSANAITRSSSSAAGTASVDVLSDATGAYIAVPATNAQWTYTNNKFQSVSNTGSYLYASGTSTFGVTSNSGSNYTTWDYNTTNGLRARRTSSSNTYRNFSGYYIYAADTIKSDPVYAAMEGRTAFTFAAGTSDIEAQIRDAITVYTATDANGTGKTEVTDYTLSGNINANTAGTYNLKVKYNDVDLGTIRVVIEEPARIEGTEIFIEGNEEEKTIYVPVTSLTNNGKYLLVNTAKNNLLVNSNNSLAGSGDFTLVTGASGTYSEYIEISNSSAVWTAVSSSGSFQLHNNKAYLRRNSTYLSTSGHTWSYSSSNNRLSSSSRSIFGTTYYYLTNSGSSWSTGTTQGSVLLYQEVTVTMGTADRRYTVQASDINYELEIQRDNTAQLNYALLANGAVTSLPGNGKWSFTVVDDHDGIIDNISDSGKITFNLAEGTCRVKIAYTWGNYVVYKYVNVTTSTDAINNYPEYSKEGAVKVNKTGTGIDFQSSGIAQVELSASGVPMKRGVDIIVMLDMSSSMDRCIECGGYTGKYSSKSASHTNSCTSKNNATARVDELKKAMNSLETTLKASANSDMMKIAIADFNGFFGSGAYARDSADLMEDASVLSGSDTGSVYNPQTGAVMSGISSDAFVPVEDMNFQKIVDNSAFKPTTGTNYDHAFDVIYQLGHAVREANGNEDRELVVIFMSDGAPNQYNYYHAIGGSSSTDTNSSEKWNYWLQGTWKQSDLTLENIDCTDHSYYYDMEDLDNDGYINEHRMANAIKGDPNKTYKVIRKNQMDSRGNWTPTDEVTNLLTATDETNVYEIPGLGATMYSVGFYITNDGRITAESVHHVLEQIPSSPDKYVTAEKEGDLEKVFNDITAELLYSAYDARFVDKMGKDFNLHYGPLVDLDGNSLNRENKIEVIEYEIYTRADFENKKCTEDEIGTRKLDADKKPIYKVLETVTFEVDENNNLIAAYSDKVNNGQTNILADGSDPNFAKDVIYAKYFLYNTSTVSSREIPAIENADGTMTTISIPTGKTQNDLTTGSSNVLPSESFYWTVGTIKTTELALRYYVYLTGSMEGTREAGSYPTNESATLYYENYVGNPAYKDTVSPVMPWKEANVSYAFYLVDEEGNIIVNQTTGEKGTFANKIAVTNPVVYQTVMLNSGTTINAGVVAGSDDVLPEGYELYDAAAQYSIEIKSDGAGSWDITKGKDPETTYVMQYDPGNAAAYTNTQSTTNGGYDYTHTVVWFAVVWKIQALPDTVVIDYGLPVDISVLANDMFGDYGKLAAVGPYSSSLETDGYTGNNLASGFGSTYEDAENGYGTAVVNTSTGKVRYTPKNMEMDKYEKFLYAVNYTGDTNSGYYYDSVTVIPATTIYYEDDFLTYTAYDNKGTGDKTDDELITSGENSWTVVGDRPGNAVQAEDRPGQYSLSDANNIYGYDAVNKGMSIYSLGQARKVTVDANTYAKAEFSFWGTGFDVISMTSDDTGVLAVDVYHHGAEKIKENRVAVMTVDTYYGYAIDHYYVTYTYNNEGIWVETLGEKFTGDPKAGFENEITAMPEDAVPGKTVVNGWKSVCTPTSNPDDAIYQVPVLQIENLEYAHYDVVLTASYSVYFDHNKEDADYDLYLDAIRIYNPANNGVISKPDSIDRDTTIQDAYKADGEAWPTYYELRDKIIAAYVLDQAGENYDPHTKIEGAMFIDGNSALTDAFISDYISYGPNNEVYLASGQSVAFLLDSGSDIANVHIGIKSANGDPVNYTIKNVAMADISDNVKAGQTYNEKGFIVDTATDMYYDLGSWKNDVIVITNVSENDSIMSLTNVKTTHTKASPSNIKSAVAPAAETDEVIEAEAPVIYMTRSAAMMTVRALNVEDEIPEETVPEVTVPEETEPETTVPEETEPEVTEPETEATEPETSAPEETDPDTGNSVVETVIGVIKELIGWLFG